MNGHDYEYLVAQFLREHGYYNVEVTKASGDYGVDVTATKNGIRYAVQCKYYSSPVGVSAVQEAVAGKAYYGCSAAMVVTNNTFTKAAYELAAANNVILKEKVTSTKSPFYKSTLPKKLKIALWAVYLFIAGGLIYAEFQIKDTQSAELVVYNFTKIFIVILSPFWIKAIVKIIKNLMSKRLQEK